MNKLWVLFCAVFAFPAASAWAQDTEVSMLPGSAPVIDGTVNAAEWADAGVRTLLLPDGADNAADAVGDVTASRTVTIRTKRQGTDFYFAFEVQDVTKPKTSPTGERLQIFFDANKSRNANAQATDFRFEYKLFRDGATPDGRKWLNGDGTVAGLVNLIASWTTQVSPVAASGIESASSDSASGYQVEVKIAMSRAGYTLAADPADFGIAIAVINDLGFQQDLGGGDGLQYILSGVGYPDTVALDLTSGSILSDIDAILPAAWHSPANWGTAFLSGAGQSFAFDQTPIYWLAHHAIQSTLCEIDDGEVVGLAPGDPGWYVYNKSPGTPCTLRLRSNIVCTGVVAPTKRRVLYLWADHGSNPQFWRYVQLTAPISIAAGTSTVGVPEFDWTTGAGLPTGLANHPCIRVFLLPENLIAPNDAAFLQAIGSADGPNNASKITQFTTAYALASTQTAQMNINAVTSPVACNPCALGDCRSTPFAALGALPPLKPHPRRGIPLELRVLLDITAIEAAPLPGRRYAFVKPNGGVREIIDLAFLREQKELRLPFDVWNSDDRPRRLFVATHVTLPAGIGDFDVQLETPPKLLFAKGEKLSLAALARIPEDLPLSLSVHAGVALPHGRMNDFLDPGAMGTLDVEYRLNPHVALRGTLGVGTFNGDAGAPDVDWYHASVGARGYLFTGRWRPYAELGGGYYAFNPGRAGAGFLAGAGLQVGLTKHLALEAGYEYHHAFLKGVDGEFSGLQVGISFGF